MQKRLNHNSHEYTNTRLDSYYTKSIEIQFVLIEVQILIDHCNLLISRQEFDYSY